MTRHVGAAEFKAKCLALIDEVQTSGESITITKRGKPVAEIKPVAPPLRARPRFGGMQGRIEILGDIVSPAGPGEEWDALR